MDKSNGKLTVYFEEPFWVGVFERISDGKLSVCKVTFGAEPKDQEVWALVLECYHELKFSPTVEAVVKQKPDNPKRRQRCARKQMESPAIGTKSQQALQMQREAMITERKQTSKAQREAEMRRQFELRQCKRKEKHKGH